MQTSVLQVVASINRRTGGPAYSVPKLADAVVHEGIESHLFSLNYREHGPLTETEGTHLHLVEADHVARRFRGFSVDASDQLRQLTASGVHLVHNHGLWMFPNLYARKAANENKLPLIVSPRGMLESWSLRRGVVRKFFVWNCWEKWNLRSAALFHATSSGEAESIRRLGFSQPIAIIPNGIDVNANLHALDDILLNRFAPLEGKRRLLFLSRLHPKKGLDILFKAWADLREHHSDWILIIAGPDLTGYQRNLEQLVRHYNLTETVLFTGMLNEKERNSALFYSDLFVLPSYSENFGIVVAESLVHQTPVLTTRNTPWSSIDDEGCGWCIEASYSALLESLGFALSQPREALDAMGKKGRSFVSRAFSWKVIGQDMSTCYQWLLHGGPIPECIHFE